MSDRTEGVALTGEQFIGIHVASAKARLAEGIKSVFAHSIPIGIRDYTRRIEMVFEGVIQGTPNSHRTRSGIVRHGAGNCGAGFVHFVDSTDIQRFTAIRFDLLHKVSIAVVLERCRLPTDGYRDEAILDVEGLGVGEIGRAHV